MDNLQKIKDNISVVIQGPIDEKTYESIDSYLDQGFSEIICSCWENCDIQLLKKSKRDYKIVTSEYPKNLKKIHNQGCRYFIAQTTLNGCLNSTKKYVLKTRSDEFYPDLSKFLKNFSIFPKKIHTTDNGFWRHIPFCFSNHLFLSQKDLMIKTCNSIIDHCIGEKFKNLKIDFPEQEFGLFFMHSLGHNVLMEDWKKLFKEKIFITPCEDLPDHLHSGASADPSKKFTRAKNYPDDRPDGHNKKYLIRNINDI